MAEQGAFPVAEPGAGAIIDGPYRYRLWRTLSATEPAERRVVFVMLNPSTADAMTDDPTVRRCVGFARREGATRLDIVNLFALRSTDPKALRSHDDPVGPDNDEHIAEAMEGAGLLIGAWGGSGPKRLRIERGKRIAVLATIAGLKLMCLGTTSAGDPLHPLYLHQRTPLREWSGGQG